MTTATVPASELAPITRELLRKCYSKYPPPPIPETLSRMSEEVVSEYRALCAACSREEEPEIVPPHKMDANICTNRCQLEMILERLSKLSAAPVDDPSLSALSQAATAALREWEDYQRSSLAKVETLIKTFLPQDFRMSIVTTFRSRSEARAASEIAQLLKAGGTVQQKYDLMWKQQLERRQSLVMLGNASGVFRVLLRYIGGVPQTLLDFVKTVNDDNGPMEEFRNTYGPMQYFLTTLSARIRRLVDVSLVEEEKDAQKRQQAAQKAAAYLQAYQGAVHEFLVLLMQVLQQSPFFVSRSDIDAANAESGQQVKVVVSKTHEVAVQVIEGDTFSWEFSSDNDIRYQVVFVRQSQAGEGAPANDAVVVLVPNTQVNSHLAPVTGQVVAPADGTAKLLLDNSYSWFSKKTVTLRTRLVPNPQKLQEQVKDLMPLSPSPAITPPAPQQ